MQTRRPSQLFFMARLIHIDRFVKNPVYVTLYSLPTLAIVVPVVPAAATEVANALRYLRSHSQHSLKNTGRDPRE